MAQKRSRSEFESDLSTNTSDAGLGNGQERPADQPASHADPRTQVAEQIQNGDQQRQDESGEWHVVGTSKKKQRRERRKAQEANGKVHDKTPGLRFDPVRIGNALRIRDLQGLVLYALADGVAPQWVAVRNARELKKVVVLMVPGMDKTMLEDTVALLSAQEESMASEDGRDAESGTTKPAKVSKPI
jgi:RNA exonuclease 1